MATQPIGEEGDVRPIVRTTAPGNRGAWIFAAVVIIGGLMLFQALSAKRAALEEARTGPNYVEGVISPPPPLQIPASFREYRAPALTRFEPQAVPAPTVREERVVMQPAPQSRSAPTEMPRLNQPAEPAFPLPREQRPVAFENPIPPPRSEAAEIDSEQRVLATRLVNPSLTIPKGTVIAAVLETALDSTRAGGVRAIVSRDVRSFDGSRVLIPRGSRLYGEYEADVSLGQKRALIGWQRLTRPDAVIIELDSPAADPLGRAGVKGKVNSHFFDRFGAQILQSVLDIGVGVATREATDGVVVALPGSTQNITGAQQTSQVQPTLTVKQGTSVSVFVAKDLDFSSVDR